MISHAIVFATLAILSAGAIYGFGKPISKSSPELPARIGAADSPSIDRQREDA